MMYNETFYHVLITRQYIVSCPTSFLYSSQQCFSTVHSRLVELV